MKVGETRVTVRLHGPAGSAEVEMLVDTGSTLTKIPESLANKTGIAAGEMVNVELADGSLRERREAQAEVELLGRRKMTPLLIGPDGEESLLGLTTLEIFGLRSIRLPRGLNRRGGLSMQSERELAVNPVTNKLEP